VTRNQRTLIVCGSYTIGKERIFVGEWAAAFVLFLDISHAFVNVAVAQALNCTVGVTKEKMSILQCLEDENVMSVVTEDWQTSQVHVLPMESLSHAVSETFESVRLICLLIHLLHVFLRS
jgi:DNA cross-link repair 1A protein